MITMPRLVTLLDKFTLGIQSMHRVTNRKTGKSRWVGSDTAEVLFSVGLGTRSVEAHIPPQARTSKHLRFRLVCDPDYHRGRTFKDKDELPDIQIEPQRPAPDEATQILPPYDFGCDLGPEDLPSGHVQFYVGARSEPFAALLRDGPGNMKIVDDSLPFMLNCWKLNGRQQPARDPRDCKFILYIKPDPGSRFPIRGQEDDFTKRALPSWCSLCKEEIEPPTAYAC